MADSLSIKPSMSGSRKGDGMLVIRQNNENKALTIEQSNTIFEQMLGYQPGQLVGQKLSVILATRTAQYFDEEMEYVDDAPDFSEVVTKQRELRFRHQFGDEMNCSGHTVMRLISQGLDSRFQLLVPNESEITATKKVREFIALHLEGRQQIDPVTGLADRQTAIACLPFLSNYLMQSNIPSAFAVLRLDRHAKNEAMYGVDGCQQLLRHVLNICKSTFRADDIVFALSDHTLGLALFDIRREAARVVLNRLRGKIRMHHIHFEEKPNFSITVSISFGVFGETDPALFFDKVERAITLLDQDERNGLIELGA